MCLESQGELNCKECDLWTKWAAKILVWCSHSCGRPHRIQLLACASVCRAERQRLKCVLRDTLRVMSSPTFISNYWKPWQSPNFKRNWIQEQWGGSGTYKGMNILQGKNWWCSLGALSLISPLDSENNVDPFELSSIGQTFVYEIIYKAEFPFLNNTQSLCRQFSQNFQNV